MISTLTNTSENTLKEIEEEMAIRKTTELFLFFPLGSQTDHLIYQQIAKLGVFCVCADPASITAQDIHTLKPTGIFLSGSPASVYENIVPFDLAIFSLGIPVLGICYGAQLLAKYLGAEVSQGKHREFGQHVLQVLVDNPLFQKLPDTFKVLQNHGDVIVPNHEMTILGTTEHSKAAAFCAGSPESSKLYGVQFHPEVSDTELGSFMFVNFIFGICNARDRFPATDISEIKINEIATKIQGVNSVIALSGGCDSSIVAYLLKRAKERCTKPTRIFAVYIKGVDRPDDEAYVRKYFGDKDWITLTVVDATQRFLECLKGKITMKEKRMSFRDPYKEILEEEIRNRNAQFIFQGTLYTDISESGGGHASLGIKKAQIKLHHNTNLAFSVPEVMPLADMVKDNARDLGRLIDVPEELLLRHPFPGPGLVVRIEGEITPEKLETAHAVDKIWIEELRAHDLYAEVWQAGAVVTKSEHTTLTGDGAGLAIVIKLWAVWSVNGFTAKFAELPWGFLKNAARRIMNEVPHTVVDYRISDKPPATIEIG